MERIPEIVGNPYVVSLSLSQYLLIRGMGKARNSSFGIPGGPNTTTDQSSYASPPTAPAIAPDSNDTAIVLRNIQFDGIQSGMVGYSLIFDGNEISGYAVQGVPDVIELVSYGQLRWSITSTQVSPFVVNFDWVTVKRDAIETLINTPLYNISKNVGGRYGVQHA